MSKVTVDDPYIHTVKEVDDRGRVYISNSLSGKGVRITVEVVDNE